jgi:dihydrofolate synthase/folylpolyglutamate synthase
VSALALGALAPGPEAIASGLRAVDWPARLQLLRRGPLVDLLPRDWQLWLDGGHNPAAGQALAASMNGADDGRRPLHLIVGMLSTKDEAGFLRPLAPLARSITTVPVPDEPASRDPVEAAQLASGLGVSARPAGDVESALRAICGTQPAPSRVLICGSLYLAGHVLRDNG